MGVLAEWAGEGDDNGLAPVEAHYRSLFWLFEAVRASLKLAI
jgi:hypothetical protein